MISGVAEDRVRIQFHQQLKTTTQLMIELLGYISRPRPSASSAILVASTGRSGSTWLGDMLSHGQGVQQVFEPFHPQFNRAVRASIGRFVNATLYSSVYLRPQSSDREWVRLSHEMLTGRHRNVWTDQYRTTYLPHRYLVKDIRANLMLGFIYSHHKPKIVYLVRHPCAVVYSRLRLGWQANVDSLLCQPSLVEDHLKTFAHRIEEERDPLGAHSVMWAVENSVASLQLRSCSHLMVAYEDLCLNPKEVLKGILSWVGLTEDGIPTELIDRPSRTDLNLGAFSRRAERISAWRQGLAHREQDRILSWAERFGLTWYGKSEYPILAVSSTGV